MKQQKSLLITSILMLGSSMIYAAEPKFSIVPAEGYVTSILLPSNFTEVVIYQITNNTKLTRTLTMVPMTGVSQTQAAGMSGANSCANPFTLAPRQSCLLELIINGSQIPPSGSKGGPVICKTKGSNDNSPDPLLCSKPKTGDTLDISVTSSLQHAYVANQLGSSVSFCQVDPVRGLLSQCSVTATGLGGVEGIGFNPAGTLFYSANLGANTISVCNVDQATGALTSCGSAGGSNFSQPDAVAFSPDGSIFYTANVGNSVTACLVDAGTGQLYNCAANTSTTFHAPSDMALNAAGTLAYVSNRSSSTVSVCNVSGQTVNSCIPSGSLLNGPEGITLDRSGLHAYIANAGDGTITLCDIRQDITGLLDNCSTTNGEFHGTGNIAFNNIGTFAYVPNQLLNAVFVCQVSQLDGTLSSCVPSLGTGFDGPAGIVIN